MQRTYCAESLSNSKETNRIVSRSQGRLDQRKWRKEPGHLEGMSLAFNDSFSTIPAGSSQTFQMVALHTTLAKFQPRSRHVFVQQGWHCRSRHQSRYNCIPLDIWIRHWVFTHLVGKHGQFSTCVIPPWSLNVTDTDAYPYINKCIYIYLKKTCHLLISWTVIARYQLLCEIELGKTLCSFNPFIQPTVLSFLAICTASISKGIKTALHSGSLLRRSSLCLGGSTYKDIGQTERNHSPRLDQWNHTPQILSCKFNSSVVSWQFIILAPLGLPKKVSDIEESTLKSHTGTWLKA